MTNARTDTTEHVAPEALSGYVDDDLPAEERERVELHFATCAECRGELAEIRRLQRGHRRLWIRLAIPSAVAAALLLTILLPRSSETPSQTRARPDVEERLGIVSPAASAEVAPASVSFSWRSAGPDATYTITLQEQDGRPIWTSVASDTLVVLPDSVRLAPGRTWFWSVDALLPNGRSLSTGPQRLRTRP